MDSMLKKRFYDIITIVYIILIIAIFLIGNRIFMDNLLKLGANASLAPIAISKLIIYSLMFVYWLFILILAIKLYKEELTNTIDLIVIILLSPLAPIFYLTNLRKSLNKHNEKKSIK